jgi:release factor glutamine methyltransferase
VSEAWTIQKLITWCTGYFNEKQIPSARLDAELLLAHVLNLRRLDLYLQFDRPLLPAELAAFKALVKRRSEHEPVAYIIGLKEFRSRDFLVSPAVLIPRPDTEILVDEALKKISAEESHGLEIGLGSGCIAISLLAERPNLTMTAWEISPEAAAIAKQNAEKHAVTERLHIEICDARNQNPETKFDFLISNPPYIRSAEIAGLQKSVAGYEPKLALDGGEDGLDFYRLIAKQAQIWLHKTGWIAVEIGEDQGQATLALFAENEWQSVVIKKDLAGLDRVLVASVS